MSSFMELPSLVEQSFDLLLNTNLMLTHVRLFVIENVPQNKERPRCDLGFQALPLQVINVLCHARGGKTLCLLKES